MLCYFSGLFSEHRSLFRNPLQYRVARRVHRRPHPYQFQLKQSWSHKFFCVADMSATHVPSSKSARDALASIGLGEKLLSLHCNAGADELHSLLLDNYPQLHSTGGYTILRCMGKSKLLKELDPPPGGHTPTSISAMVGQSKVYIRPLQCSIPLTAQQSRSGGVEEVRSNVIYTHSYSSLFNRDPRKNA